MPPHTEQNEHGGHTDRVDRVDINVAVRVTGLHQQTIYRLARQKRIRSYRLLGRSVRFDLSDLLELAKPRQ